MMKFKSKKIFTTLLILMPILDQYTFFSISNWEIFTLLSFIMICFSKEKLKYNKRYQNCYLCMIIYGVIATLSLSMSYIGIGIIPFAFRIMKLILVTINILMISTVLLDIEYAHKLLKKVVVFIVILFFVQYFIHIFKGKYIYFLLPNCTLNYNDGINSSAFMLENMKGVLSGYYFRPSSIFIEPAFYSTYCILSLIIILIKDDIEIGKNTILSLIISGSIVLTTSSLGLLGCFLIWIIYIYKFVTTKQKIKNIKKFIFLFIPIFILGVMYMINQQGVITSFFIKMNSLHFLDQESSLTMRLFRGMAYYNKMDGLHKFLGVGYGNLSLYYNMTGMSTVYDSGNQVSYMNGLSSILCSFGIIGFSLFLGFLKKNWNKKSLYIRTLVYTLILFMLTSDCFDSPIFYILICFILNENYNYQKQNEVNL